MKRNPSMTEEDWRWFELWQEARKLSAVDIESLEEQLRIDQSHMDVRVQLFSYYNEYAGNKLKHKNAEKKLFEHVSWLIENRPTLSGFIGHRIAMTGRCYKPKSFAKLRQVWLDQVSAAPSEGIIAGNAASFIAWNDFETASDLFERAAALHPAGGWLGLFVVHCNSELYGSTSLYQDKIRERIIDVGVRSLQSESDGAPFLTCEFVSDAALCLGRFDLVRWCAEIMRINWPDFENIANAYFGLVALREGNRDLAIELMLKTKHGYQPHDTVFRLARELFDVGERASIIQLIKSFKRKIKATSKYRWLEQIAQDQAPDFEDYC